MKMTPVKLQSNLQISHNVQRYVSRNFSTKLNPGTHINIIIIYIDIPF